MRNRNKARVKMMLTTRGFEAETFNELRANYAEYYSNSFVSEGDVGYIAFVHNNGNEHYLSSGMMYRFIKETNALIAYNATENNHYLSYNETV